MIILILVIGTLLFGMQESTPQYLYKVITKENYEKSCQKKSLYLTNTDRPFIHLAKESQVPKVVNKFFDNQECVVLKIPTKKLEGRLVYEKNPGGKAKYYHLYEGHIPFSELTIANNFISIYNTESC